MADNEVLNLILSHIEGIGKAQEGMAKTQQETALLVERLAGRMSSAEQDIKEIKNRPNTERANIGTFVQIGGCLGSVLFAFLTMTSISITVVMYVSQHWH